MADEPTPEQIDRIPSDLDPGERIHVAGQVAIQALMHALSFEDKGARTVATDEMLLSLSMALAMLIAGDARNGTPQAVRKGAESYGKIIAGYAKILVEQDDRTPAQLMKLLGLEQSSFDTN